MTSAATCADPKVATDLLRPSGQHMDVHMANGPNALQLRCGWCDKLLRDSTNGGAHPTTGICVYCAMQVELDSVVTALRRRCAGLPEAAFAEAVSDRR